MSDIPFNLPLMTGMELEYIKDAHLRGHLSGNGFYTKKSQELISNIIKAKSVLLTHSCTSALEMSSLLLGIAPGDEVILPSYTFVSTANAFVLRGAVPVFVDIRSDTLNMDESKIEAAITDKTKVIIPVHYAGIACDLDPILGIAKRHHIKIVEDAAQAMLSKYKGRYLGTIGDIGTFSFHETKNISSGEGGAIVINNAHLVGDAEVIWEKGTDRSRFLRGEVDKYTWRKCGSSYLPGELIAAFLFGQLYSAHEITSKRLDIWNGYHVRFENLENLEKLRRPIVPNYAEHNGHMYYILTRNSRERETLIAALRDEGIHAISHYEPLHSSEAGKLFGRSVSPMNNTNSLASRIVRLPLWVGLSESDLDRISDAVTRLLN